MIWFVLAWLVVMVASLMYGAYWQGRCDELKRRRP
jgi:hypothetical protein